MSLVRYYPRRNLVPLPREIDRFFSNFGMDMDSSDTVWSPSVDISETEKSYEVIAEIPGMDKKDIKISVQENVLLLSGEKKKEEEKEGHNYHRIERSYGKFERSFKLPTDVKADEIKAKYKDGVLSVEIPKAEEVKPKEITVS